MNYSFKKHHFRLLTLVLCSALMASAMSGCGKKDEEVTPPSESTPPGLVEVTPTETTAPKPTEDPSATPLEPGTARVISQELTVLSAPSSTGQPIGTLNQGTIVDIIKVENVLGIDWALIREGWVAAEHLEMGELDDNMTTSTPAETTPGETTPAQTITESIKGIVTGDYLNIRIEPNENSDIVGGYSKGDAVTILETKNGWGRTNKGWISMKFVNTSANANTQTTTPENTDTTTTTQDGTAYFVTTGLNIRSQASINGEALGVYTEGTRVIVTETSNGWGKTDKGWVSMQYLYKTGDKGNNGCNGVVTGNNLNVRSGPGTTYGGVDTLNAGARVTILQRITVDGKTWGCVSNGWISMDYVYVDGTEGDGAGTGAVIADTLNIRSGPGTGYQSVGSLEYGENVEILAQFKIGEVTWGCIKEGWISMEFVNMG